VDLEVVAAEEAAVVAVEVAAMVLIPRRLMTATSVAVGRQDLSCRLQMTRASRLRLRRGRSDVHDRLRKQTFIHDGM
jgi:hypothetical protein